MKTPMSFGVCLVLVLTFATVGIAQDTSWPRTRIQDGNTLTAYQPQVDS